MQMYNMKRIITCFLYVIPVLSLAQTPMDSIAVLESYFDLSYSAAERDSLFEGLRANQGRIELIHAVGIENHVPPAMVFMPAPFHESEEQLEINWNLPGSVEMPERREDLAFLSVAQLSVLLREQKISSVELTQFFLDRLHHYNDTLKCVVSFLEDRAIKKAKEADQEIAEGKYRGPLHGIPYGLKDLFAVEGTVTSWGAMAYKDQVIEETATVVKKLDEAGAVLIAKLTLGALAMGDVWYGGVTKNPWNLSQGSSGSSAGSASAVSAGLVPFAIGTETLGSIVSPSTRCGVTGLRPTFGRVSRFGGMALSWSMDKVGPIARSAKDCALVFDVIRGTDGKDPSLIDDAFNYGKDVRDLKVAYLQEDFARSRNIVNDSLAIKKLRELGIELHAITIPDELPIYPLTVILASEAAAAFDQLTRSGRDSLLVRQDKGAWPNYFRTARFIPAVEYVNANRIRTELIAQFNELIEPYDVIIAPSFGTQLVLTNLTGHPCLVMPNGFSDGSPTSISLIGKMMGEAALIAIGELFQNSTDFDDKHPEMFLN
jgi:Asp-tRNA(Asn)/Glu-tRNA(Gln) amidotransferase A subunit family amidase